MTTQDRISRQQGQIIDYMKAHGSLTGSDAVMKLGVYDYRKRISELRQRGHDIVDIWEPHEGGRHKRYFLGGGANG